MVIASLFLGALLGLGSSIANAQGRNVPNPPELDSTHVNGLPSSEMMVNIRLSSDHIEFPKGVLIVPTATPQGSGDESQASVLVEASSPLPEWGVMAQAQSIKGPAGEIAPDFIWTKTAANGDSFQPFTSPVPVIVHTPQARSAATEVGFAVRPSWLVPAGTYQGNLVMNPYLPDMSAKGMSPRYSGLDLGPPRTVSIQFSIAETIELSLSTTEIYFDASAGPREEPYISETALTFRVSTNAHSWRVVYEASPLENESNKEAIITPDRIEWHVPEVSVSRPRADKASTDITCLSSPTLLSGNSPVRDISMRIWFCITINPQDVAGIYHGTVTLMGITEP